LTQAEYAVWEAAAVKRKMPLAKFISETMRQALKGEEGGGI
jgi:hypothetical protein